MPVLSARYFDGVSARPRIVALQICGDVLVLAGEGVERAVALADVQWPERTRHGQRVAHFKGGGSVQCADIAAWDAWSRGSALRESIVVKMQQSWRWVLASVLVLLAMGVAMQQWGLPLAARAVVLAMPLGVDQSLGEASIAMIDQHLMQPSKLPLMEQERLRVALTRALATLPAGEVPAWQLQFRASRAGVNAMGPNAFALPGGTLILTDELVALVGRDEAVITAVLAHEIGHVRHRHGVRLLVQATVIGGLATVVLGDFSTLLAAVPTLLAQASYSRDAEREADAVALRVLQAARISPLVMVTLFDKLAEGKNRSPSLLGIAFSSHPPDAERVRYFKEAAAQR